jgi:Flp pilus assembly protein TadD
MAPLEAQSAFAAGKAAYDEHEYEAAYRQLTRALQLGLDTPRLRNQLGLASRRVGKDVEAEQHWAAAIESDSQYVPAIVNLGVLESDREKFDDARALYQRAARAHPTHPRPQYNLGSLALNQDQPETAIAYLKKAVRFASGHEKAKALNNLGLAYKRTGQAEEAREALGEAILVKPGYVKARMNLASVQPDSREGRIRKAKLYRDVLSLKPGHSRAETALAELDVPMPAAPGSAIVSSIRYDAESPVAVQ